MTAKYPTLIQHFCWKFLEFGILFSLAKSDLAFSLFSLSPFLFFAVLLIHRSGRVLLCEVYPLVAATRRFYCWGAREAMNFSTRRITSDWLPARWRVPQQLWPEADWLLKITWLHPPYGSCCAAPWLIGRSCDQVTWGQRGTVGCSRLPRLRPKLCPLKRTQIKKAALKSHKFLPWKFTAFVPE